MSSDGDVIMQDAPPTVQQTILYNFPLERTTIMLPIQLALVPTVVVTACMLPYNGNSGEGVCCVGIGGGVSL